MSTLFPNPSAEVSDTPPKKAGVLRATFRAFHYHNFRLMWFGAFTSTSGFFVQEVAQSWLVYEMSKSEFYLGLTAFLNGAPILLLSLLGGVAADRMDRRKLLLTSQYIQMTSAVVLAVLVGLDLIQVWHIMAAAFVNGLGQAFGGPAFQALIPSLVEEEDLPNAIALMSIQFTLARVVGSVIGGGAFALLGAFACFAINGASFLAVILALYVIHVRFVPKKTDVHVLESLKEGLTFVRRNHVILALMILAPVTAFLGVPLVTLLPVFAAETFHLDPRGYSMMLAFWGSGAVVGALHVAWLGNTPRKGRTTLLMQVGLGLTISAFAISTNFWVACVFLFLSGWTVLALFALVNSLVQLQAREEMRGRIMSVYHTAFRGAMPLGNLAIGTLAGQIGAPLAMSASGMLLVLVAVWYLLRDKQVSQL